MKVFATMSYFIPIKNRNSVTISLATVSRLNLTTTRTNLLETLHKIQHASRHPNIIKLLLIKKITMTYRLMQQQWKYSLKTIYTYHFRFTILMIFDL